MVNKYKLGQSNIYTTDKNNTNLYTTHCEHWTKHTEKI